MNGRDIIELWNAAKQTVLDAHAQPGGSLGNRIRGKYDIAYNGYSVCDFVEKKLMIAYGADCCSRPWTIYNSVVIGNGDGWTRISDIDPDSEYDVGERLSPIEKFECGLVTYGQFVVRKESGRNMFEKRYFDDFKSADEAARKWCREELDRCNRDPTWSLHTPSSVSNDEQRARECGELKHYEYYQYDGYHYWISVEGEI